ncbi:hypothetical protein CANARDRAFT_58257 [[Candida] arabinofermentans NRRL YB-2248]|uniref:Uncharacterized protein n=1 Tax=[Candida] arabinofermentans NRRL YB-2248 TaxID=983967 RepID=A0A1E4T8Y9_9ASCO|nr:hypothetical protein CANARDRAFT_58257 [[Candida] arabinofermentans NRRL YB-2248]
MSFSSLSTDPSAMFERLHRANGSLLHDHHSYRLKLTSTSTYYAWYEDVCNSLYPYGNGIVDYFQSGITGVPDNTECPPQLVAQLELVITTIIRATVSHTMRNNYPSSTYGRTLLLLIQADYQHESPRGMYQLVEKMFTVRDNPFARWCIC